VRYRIARAPRNRSEFAARLSSALSWVRVARDATPCTKGLCALTVELSGARADV
jgi:hypothetical protein